LKKLWGSKKNTGEGGFKHEPRHKDGEKLEGKGNLPSKWGREEGWKNNKSPTE
jgi:hypothetical protein